jgi:hypothetical protein
MEATVPRKPGNGSNIVLVGVLMIGILVALAVGGFFLSRYMHDPYCTLEPFPVGKFLDSYRGLSGSNYRAEV